MMGENFLFYITYSQYQLTWPLTIATNKSPWVSEGKTVLSYQAETESPELSIV